MKGWAGLGGQVFSLVLAVMTTTSGFAQERALTLDDGPTGLGTPNGVAAFGF